MNFSSELFARSLLRYSSHLTSLRRIRVAGGMLGWVSRKLVPHDALIWVAIQQGAAKGLSIRVNPRTGRAIHEGLLEPAVQDVLKAHLRPGMVFYDLGANIGFFSLIGARLVGPTGKVVSFEADPEICHRLRENISQNRFAHVIVEQKAVWSSTGTLSFARSDPAVSPDRGLGRVSSDNSSNGIHVEATSLDEYTSLSPAPDVLKCDVEGGECAVLRGARRLLLEKRPVLLVEVHCSQNAEELSKILTEVGYSFRNLDEAHILAVATGDLDLKTGVA